ncbi:Sodium and chloride-dependent GABA transporter 2 [Fusarium tjaetaba]|uniref:Sodium and chloride-dependent GABA transporter 2 n=1 Tax=Fusarium tjaetaba TaxID=1567544 RepID=A0A8H5W1K3_9HYPO|nr:Sodium and chloride-dependent GABA transporter 2 [Fusarium tjaetaba]KAF5642230.1 Sodium and chloride-dependent GABA transporter 2 [Fusarium tjaetaba]
MGIILIERGVSLPNASEDIKLYFASWPSSKLAGTKVWRDAVGQVFFSTGVGFRYYTAYASYNRKFANAAQDAVIIVLFNSSFEALVAFAVFGIVGYLGMRPEGTGDIGSYGLGFMTYPEAFIEIPASGFFSVIFLFTIMLLGISLSFAMLDAVMTLILDSPFAINWSRPWVTTTMVTICFLLSLPHCTEFGYFSIDVIGRWINNIGLITSVFYYVVFYSTRSQLCRRQWSKLVSPLPLGTMPRYIPGSVLAIIFSLAYPSFEEVKNAPLYILGSISAHLLLVWCVIGFVFPRWFNVFIVPGRRDDWKQPYAPNVLRGTTEGGEVTKAETGMPSGDASMSNEGVKV